MHVERVQGDYIAPEIIDLDDGSGCLFRLHETDISEDGVKPLAQLLTEQAQFWAPRPAGSPPGPVVPVRWERVPDPPDPLAIGVDDSPCGIIYTLDEEMLSQRAADYLGRLDTERSPYWQRVPKGYHG
ncbi:hypothetical protein MUK60_07790 [Streptomyces sp. LRE541]|uniref:hypothetical protein n=1 Tax=Streptomyces sp. LRE541 TaxID=2931983 RepID=UPI00200FAC3E|nr:hypothetical protein [Streptomyces sp. LRE541]UPZ27736.1 hypothetical protein MUK60_07790 [Streptomyces sp. LRE541]